MQIECHFAIWNLLPPDKGDEHFRLIRLIWMTEIMGIQITVQIHDALYIYRSFLAPLSTKNSNTLTEVQKQQSLLDLLLFT